MFTLSVCAVILTGSLLGSAVACVVDASRKRKLLRENEVDYKALLGPNFSRSIQPSRVTYRTAEVRKSRLVLQDFSQREGTAA